MAINNVNALLSPDILKDKTSVTQTPSTGDAFAQSLKSAMNDVNDMQETSEKAMSDIATGQVKDLHQAALAIDKAEISMKLMLEVRNKALNAYQQISRTQM
jgi:flagellar hook-basal body complex protein FliE